MVGIYKIASPSGKVYIGQSWDVLQRRRYYRHIRCVHQPKLYSSLVKHGWDSHTFEIVQVLPSDITQEVLNKYEIFYWQQHIDCGFEMMNVKEPGSMGKHSRGTIEKLKARVLSPRSLEHSANISKAKQGIPQPKASIDKRQQTRKDRKRGTKKLVHIETGYIYESGQQAGKQLGYSPQGICFLIRKGLLKHV
jgi:group I intron endonuclease